MSFTGRFQYVTARAPPIDASKILAFFSSQTQEKEGTEGRDIRTSVWGGFWMSAVYVQWSALV